MNKKYIIGAVVLIIVIISIIATFSMINSKLITFMKNKRRKKEI